jgi:hypothetical protein
MNAPLRTSSLVLQRVAGLAICLAAATAIGEVKTLNLDFSDEGMLAGTVTSLNAPGGNVWNQYDFASYPPVALVDQFGAPFDLIGDPTGTGFYWIPFPNVSEPFSNRIAVRELADTSPVDMSIIFEDVGGAIYSQFTSLGRNSLPFTVNSYGVDSLGVGFIDYLGPDAGVGGSLQFTTIFGASGLRRIGTLTLLGLSPVPTTIGDPALPGVILDLNASASIEFLGMQVRGQFVSAPEPSSALIASLGIAALLPSSRRVR